MDAQITHLSATNQTVIPAVGDWQVLRPIPDHTGAFVRFEHYLIIAWLIEVEEPDITDGPSATTHPITSYGITFEPYGIKDGFSRIHGAHQFESFGTEAELLAAINLAYPVAKETSSQA